MANKLSKNVNKSLREHGISVETVPNHEADFTPPPLPTPGEYLKKQRVTYHFSQQDVADNAGIHLTTYQRYEADSLDILKAEFCIVMDICSMIDADPDFLYSMADLHRAR